MNIKGVENETDRTDDIELECPTCGYTRVISAPRGKLIVRSNCPQCKQAALQKKHQQMISHQKDL